MKHIKIISIIPSPNSRIDAIATGLTYKEYTYVECMFLLISNLVLCNTIKSINLNNTIELNTSFASSYTIKNINNIPEDDLILSALLITSIEKTVEITNKMNLSNMLNVSLNKITGEIVNQSGVSFEFSSEFSSVVSKIINTISNIQIDNKIFNSATNKVVNSILSDMAIDDLLKSFEEKYIYNINSQISIDNSIVDYQIIYLRKLLELDLLTFADIDGDTLAYLDMVEKKGV